MVTNAAQIWPLHRPSKSPDDTKIQFYTSKSKTSQNIYEVDGKSRVGLHVPTGAELESDHCQQRKYLSSLEVSVWPYFPSPPRHSDAGTRRAWQQINWFPRLITRYQWFRRQVISSKETCSSSFLTVHSFHMNLLFDFNIQQVHYHQ